ncbi:MAG: alcohol dehydrogenase catalytic domain-containing protein [Kiritimatiellae bacterium]|nr:alcohol dehydrogenase catalytic domain-containing protein [Kiritimatiellia bacterium]
MKQTMKAARLFGPNDLRLMDVPIPELGPRDILSKVKRAGLCGTDYSIYSGEFSFVKNGLVRFPFTPGHEWSGVVVAVGSEVVNFKPGDRIIGETFVSCGKCDFCLRGRYDNCQDVRSVGTINAWDGGFAEYTVFPDRHIFHLPDSVSFDAGAFVEPAATSLNAIQMASVQLGDVVLVHGSGPLGLLAAKLAKLSGASKVFVTGRKDAKLTVARSFGADVAINTTRESFAEVLARHTTNGKVDRVIETSGSFELLLQSLDVIRTRGTLAAVAFYDRVLQQVEIDKIVFGQISLVGASGSTGTYEPVMALMASGDLDITPLISGRYRLKDILQGYRDMKDRNDIRIKWLVDCDDAEQGQ